MAWRRHLSALEGVLISWEPVAVAVSGGVDSMTLAFVAHRALRRCTMVHARSPAVPAAASARVEDYAAACGWHLKLIDAGEMEDPDYVGNPVNRCYYCKNNLYRAIGALTDATVIAGTNVDDLDDYRPGLRAAAEYGVGHPYVKAGMDKQAVRALAGALGLDDLKELPAAPCLSSRITTGISISPDLLPLIDLAENRVRELLADSVRLSAVRCRIRKDGIAVQLDTDTPLDDSFPFTRDLRQAVQEVFLDSGLLTENSIIKIEPYLQGSAFVRMASHGP